MSPKKSPKAVVTSATDEQQLSRRATERWTLKDAADELSKQSHAWDTPNTPNEWLAILEKLVTEELLQPQGGEVLADEVNALLKAHPQWVPRLPSARKAAEHVAIRRDVGQGSPNFGACTAQCSNVVVAK